tara:strand:+ start:1136 stop:2080 length:945 start_codon:yes stop_codon:yes gene_type:complete
MKKVKSILLVINNRVDDQLAIERAKAMQKLTKCKLTVVKMVDNMCDIISASMPFLPSQVKLKKLMLEDLQKEVGKVVGKKSNELIKYKLLEGTAFLSITREVMKHKHDLVIVSAEGQKKVDAGLFGSSNFHLLRKCPCSIWIVKPKEKKLCKNIVVAVDIDPTDKVKVDLNKKLMQSAIVMAKQFSATLHVLHAWQLYGEDTLKNSPFIHIDKSALAELLKSKKLVINQNFKSFLNEFESDDVEIIPEVKKGKISTMLPNYVRKNRIDLIVMGTVCRVGISGFLIGNTAEAMLQKINCSVLAVKPDGFVSPVDC